MAATGADWRPPLAARKSSVTTRYGTVITFRRDATARGHGDWDETCRFGVSVAQQATGRGERYQARLRGRGLSPGRAHAATPRVCPTGGSKMRILGSHRQSPTEPAPLLALGSPPASL